MKVLAIAIICLSATPAVLAAVDVSQQGPAWGMDAAGALELAGHGEAPAYGTLWVGPWTMQHGWSGPMDTARELQDAGIVPVIHAYYWGDDISQDCILHGCWSDLHGVQKTPAGWDAFMTRLGKELAGLDGDVIVVLETEFNKADVQRWEPLDGMLARHAQGLHEAAPGTQVVLALGNWNQAAWSTWDRTAAAADIVGIQAMRAITRDDETEMRGLYDDTVAGLEVARALFHRPLMIHDLAVSSYHGHEATQADVIQDFVDGADRLGALGVQAIVYRSWRDVRMDAANYYGAAERHWGLADGDGVAKQAGSVWMDAGGGNAWALWLLPLIPMGLLLVVPRSAGRHSRTPA